LFVASDCKFIVKLRQPWAINSVPSPHRIRFEFQFVDSIRMVFEWLI
jgi:hypothetical protein